MDTTLQSFLDKILDVKGKIREVEMEKNNIQTRMSNLYSTIRLQEQEIIKYASKFQKNQCFTYKGSLCLKIIDIDVEYNGNPIQISFRYTVESSLDSYRMLEREITEKLESGEWEEGNTVMNLPTSVQLLSLSCRERKEENGAFSTVYVGITKKAKTAILFTLSSSWSKPLDVSGPHVYKIVKRPRSRYNPYELRWIAQSSIMTKEQKEERRKTRGWVSRNRWSSASIHVEKIYPTIEDLLADLL